MKKLATSFIVTLFFINNAMAGTVSDYLGNRVSKLSIADDLVSDPQMFEEKLSILAKEIQSQNLLDSTENRLKILELEKVITHAAIAHNQKAQDKNQLIRVGSAVIGALIGGAAGYYLSGGSAKAKVAGKNLTETFENAGSQLVKSGQVFGITLVSAGAGAAAVYGLSKTDLANKYLIQAIDLETINLDTNNID